MFITLHIRCFGLVFVALLIPAVHAMPTPLIEPRADHNKMAHPGFRPTAPHPVAPVPPSIAAPSKEKKEKDPELHDFRITVYDPGWIRYTDVGLRAGDKLGLTTGIKSALGLTKSIKARYMNDDLDGGRSIGILKFIFVAEPLGAQLEGFCGSEFPCVGYRVVLSAVARNKHAITSIYQLKQGASGVEFSSRPFETKAEESILETMEEFKIKFENLLKEKVKDPTLPWWEDVKPDIAQRDTNWLARDKNAKQESRARYKAKSVEGTEAPTWFDVVLAPAATSHGAAEGENHPNRKHGMEGPVPKPKRHKP